MIARAKPLLGTIVHIEARGADEAVIADAFNAVARVHAAMSFQEPKSELSRLNRAEPGVWVQLSSALAAVLDSALAVAEQSAGAFDPVRAAHRAVEAGALPDPGGPSADPNADWRDLELAPGGAVRKARALWIDLGGIAKGYAVDRAVEQLTQHGVASGLVDAGGDLRAFGGPPRQVALNARAHRAMTPVLELADGALAGSGALRADPVLAAQAHIDGRDGRPIDRSFAAVCAPDCTTADALTKVVLAMGERAEASLRKREALGFYLAPGGDWRTLGAAA